MGSGSKDFGFCAAGAYLWVQATYVLPAASCGLSAMPGQPPGTPGAARCFAAAGVRVHWQGTESATDHAYVIRAGGTPGRYQVADYMQVGSIGLPGPVKAAACQASVTAAGVAISCPPVPTTIITIGP